MTFVTTYLDVNMALLNERGEIKGIKKAHQMMSLVTILKVN